MTRDACHRPLTWAEHRRRILTAVVVQLLVVLLAAPGQSSAQGADNSPEWHDLDSRVRPPGASGATLAYDEARDELVLFGGFGDEPMGTWVRRAGSWVSLQPETEPSPRHGATMLYDSIRQEVVLFGGWTASGGRSRTDNATWIWDGVDWRLATPAVSPPSRAYAAAGFDRVRGQLLLFGGRTRDSAGETEIHGDTWTWDGNQWTELHPAVSPSPRSNAGATFHAASRELIFFGGSQPPPPDPCEQREPVSNSCLINAPSDPTREQASPVLADTWAWDGSTWTERSPEHSPSARMSAALAYDPTRNVSVLFGGVHPGVGAHTDTWLWDGADWTEVHPEHRPSRRFGVAMAGDPDNGQVIAFGGHQVTNTARDTWAWDGADWTVADQPPTPEPRYHAASAYDAEHDELLLFGGDGHRRHGDTWIYDDGWRRRTTAVSPTPRAAATAAYDDQRRQVVLFGGHDGRDYDDTWVWNGVTWRDVRPEVFPPARRHSAMAYDPARRRVVLFGGQHVRSGNECPVACDPVVALGDTWTWDGANWTQQQPPVAPPPLVGATMVYDAARGEVVLFGGFDDANEYNGETWTWGGTTWTQEQPETRPAGRAYATISYDPVIERVVLFSGLQPGGGRADVWLWDGTSWSQAHPVEGPSSRLGATMTYHPGLRGSLLFNGSSRDPRDDTWLLRPAKQETSLDLTVERQGQSKFLRASLTELDAPSGPIAGRTIQFYSDGELIGSVDTDTGGLAVLVAPPMHSGANRTYEAVFEGDETYLASSDKSHDRSGKPE